MVLQTALTAWAEAHAAGVAAATKGLRHFVVDGKSLRWRRRQGLPQAARPGILDVTAVTHGVFLTQRQIDAKTHEIGMFTDVMDQVSSLDGDWRRRMRCTARPSTPRTWTGAARACW